MKLILLLCSAISVFAGSRFSRFKVPYSESFISTEKQAIIDYYSQVSSFAYCVNDTAKAVIDTHPSLSNHMIIHSPLSGMSGFAATDEGRKQVVVVFRGTTNAKNWMFNFYASKSSEFSPNGKVHSGFGLAYESIKYQVRDVVCQQLEHKIDYSLLFAGHSLGAAMATLAISDGFGILSNDTGYIMNKCKSKITASDSTLFTVASPRVGSREFASTFHSAGFKETIRLVNDVDIVPHLPPTSLGYSHVRNAYWINPDGKYVSCNDSETQEDTDCANSYRGLRIGMKESIEKHLMSALNMSTDCCHLSCRREKSKITDSCNDS